MGAAPLWSRLSAVFTLQCPDSDGFISSGTDQICSTERVNRKKENGLDQMDIWILSNRIQISFKYANKAGRSQMSVTMSVFQTDRTDICQSYVINNVTTAHLDGSVEGRGPGLKKASLLPPLP